ncbi:FliI/YscN family ATPase [Sulfitobacter sp. 20_GPM-1509m]|uniref:FliI/YscN family ATPase n=1 Tax=Sulfitobacter sp. 20_GPM-1509m TaxID=1380367 RepID=UPI0009DD5526|nr:FliI/YscN family ATPase [Sulfitobacter sp. 20_GPM-1509m]
MTVTSRSISKAADAEAIAEIRAALSNVIPRPQLGWVRAVSATVVHVALGDAPIGAICRIGSRPYAILAEVIATSADTAILSPYGGTVGLSGGTLVTVIDTCQRVAVGDALLGRVLDGLGRPIDGAPVPVTTALRPIRADAPDPLTRPLIEERLHSGLRAIDAFTPLGRGQRMAILGPPGAGKSGLLSALAANCDVDAVVIAMVGERGREVREFIEVALPAEKRDRAVVIVATSDRPPSERVACVHTATTIAEDMRARGKSVLLLVDSLTRVARALREIGLAAGEPPTRRGYPASVYAALPAIVERAGTAGEGAITALYTVLVEGDGEGDPIAEEVRSLTDGHISLDAAIAARGRYPAIDILNSLSRLATAISETEDLDRAREARKLLAKYNEIELLLQIGEYEAGSDAVADRAIATHDPLDTFLSQPLSEGACSMQATRAGLTKVLS